ncbi:MAG: NUDIX hydrolase [Myxococcales bacterium]|nr:NUDIX hydrolase [Myxococcales bacterium]
MLGRFGRLLQIAPHYAYNAWEGLFGHRVRGPSEVAQGVIQQGDRVLLCMRSNLRGWELPGGNLGEGESPEDGARREILEETGLEVEVGDLVGRYRRSGFLPHTAWVYRCRVCGGEPTPSPETPRVEWFELANLPETIFPWFAGPLKDALTGARGLERNEYQGLGAILAGAKIDIKNRLRG